MKSGKEKRLQRLMNNGRCVMIPMDHGVTLGPIKGLEDINEAVAQAASGGGDAVVLHRGVACRVNHNRLSLVVHLFGSTKESADPSRKVRICSVKQAVRLGADAVSLHCNVGVACEHDMMVAMGSVIEEAEEYGIPVLAMMYHGGKDGDIRDKANRIMHVVRLGAELGADIIKTSYTGDMKSFQQVVAHCPVPILVAGGPKMDTDLDVFRMVHDALACGAAGVAIGRNVFQHRYPARMVAALSALVHHNATPDQALGMIGEDRVQGAYALDFAPHHLPEFGPLTGQLNRARMPLDAPKKQQRKPMPHLEG